MREDSRASSLVTGWRMTPEGAQRSVLGREGPGVALGRAAFPGLVKHSGGNAKRAVRRMDPGIRRDRDMKETVVEAVRITAGQEGVEQKLWEGMGSPRRQTFRDLVEVVQRPARAWRRVQIKRQPP